MLNSTHGVGIVHTEKTIDVLHKPSESLVKGRIYENIMRSTTTETIKQNTPTYVQTTPSNKQTTPSSTQATPSMPFDINNSVKSTIRTQTTRDLQPNSRAAIMFNFNFELFCYMILFLYCIF